MVRSREITVVRMMSTGILLEISGSSSPFPDILVVTYDCPLGTSTSSRMFEIEGNYVLRRNAADEIVLDEHDKPRWYREGYAHTQSGYSIFYDNFLGEWTIFSDDANVVSQRLTLMRSSTAVAESTSINSPEDGGTNGLLWHQWNEKTDECDPLPHLRVQRLQQSTLADPDKDQPRLSTIPEQGQLVDKSLPSSEASATAKQAGMTASTVM